MLVQVYVDLRELSGLMIGRIRYINKKIKLSYVTDTYNSKSAATLGAAPVEISVAKPHLFGNEGASRSPLRRRLRRFSPQRAHADVRVGGAFFAVCHRTPAHPEPRRAHLTDDPWRVCAFVQVCDRLTQSRRVMLHLKREGEVRHLLINYIADTVRQRNDELPKPIARARLYHLTSA